MPITKKFTSLLLISIIILTTVTASSCCCRKKNCKNKQAAESVQPITPVIKDVSASPPDAFDYKIESASVQGNVLNVDVSYSGGCGTHKWDLVWTGLYLKSMPMKVPLFIRHTATSETCDKPVKAKLSYDLSILNPGYSEELILLLKGFEGDLQFNLK